MMNLRRLLPVAALLLAAPFLVAQGAPARPAATKPAAVTKAAAAGPSKDVLLDINTAAPDQLKALPGVGDVYTKRIIDGRPYTAKNQLMTRGILPKGTYEGIASRIIAKRMTK